MNLKNFGFSSLWINVFNFIICVFLFNRHAISQEDNAADHPSLTHLRSCLSSLQKIKWAYDLEMEVIHLMDSLYKTFEVTGEIDDITEDGEIVVKAFSKFVKEQHEEEKKSTFPLLHHPVNTLHFARRILTKFNPFLMDLRQLSIRSKIYKKFEDMITGKIISLGCWFRSLDENVLIVALSRAFSTYQPPIKEFINGDIYGYKSIEPLGWDDFLQIIYNLKEEDYHAEVVNIADYLLTKMLDKVKETNVLRRLYRIKANSLFKLARPKEAIKLLEEYLRDNDDASVRRDLKRYKDDKHKAENEPHPESFMTDYRKICRGGYKRPLLTCRYKCPQKGWYCVRQELLNKKPYVVRYYNILHDEEIDIMKALANEKNEQETEAYNKMAKSNQRKKLSLSTVFKTDGTDQTHSQYRLSETAWIYDNVSATLDEFAKRIAFITGLITAHRVPASCEPFQVVNYGFAGMYYAHWDYFQEDNSPGPNRILHDRVATWITYLSDVELGGGTAFVRKNLLVESIKGSAVFWYNITKNGRRIYDTLHGGCPTLVGDKWISNKWFLEDSQMFVYKCDKRRTRKVTAATT